MQNLPLSRRAAISLLLPVSLLLSLPAATQTQAAKSAPPQATSAAHIPPGSPLPFVLIDGSFVQFTHAEYDRLAALAPNPGPQTESPQAGPK